MSRPLVLLHGFTGSPASWDDVRARLAPGVDVLAPALLGHDGTPGPAGIRDFDDELDRLAGIVRVARLQAPHVAGYSLGGRVALGLLVRHPDLFAAATLIGANPGLPDTAARAARAAGDREWARLLDREGLSTFVAAWEALPLFGTQHAADATALDRQRRIRLGHDPAGLRRALDVLGLAAMPDYRASLAAIDVPVDLVVGALDTKFRPLAEEMGERLPRARIALVARAGHNVVLERPDEVARLLQELDS